MEKNNYYIQTTGMDYLYVSYKGENALERAVKQLGNKIVSAHAVEEASSKVRARRELGLE